MTEFTIHIEADKICDVLERLTVAMLTRTSVNPTNTPAAVPVSAPVPIHTAAQTAVNPTPAVPVSAAAVPVAPVAPVTATSATPAPVSQAIFNPTQTSPAITMPPITPPIAPPVSAKTYTLDDMLNACAPLLDAGKKTEVVGLINSLGAQKLADIPPAKYNELAAGLRSLGGKI